MLDRSTTDKNRFLSNATLAHPAILAPHDIRGRRTRRHQVPSLETRRGVYPGQTGDRRRYIQMAGKTCVPARLDIRSIDNQRYMNVLVIEHTRQIAADTAIRMTGFRTVIARDQDSRIIGQIVTIEEATQFTDILIDKRQPEGRMGSRVARVPDPGGSFRTPA